MKYIRVGWTHRHPEDPVLLYSELDAQRCEVRKVDVFRDGRLHYASDEGTTGDTELSEAAIPALSELARDPQFEPVEIERAEFEAVWEQRHRGQVEGGALNQLTRQVRAIERLFR
jgi:hypothetical protein